jgi:2,3-bisphosphoglycerate-independent phosphoglycerate mutase
MSLIFVFIDGVGLAPASPDNPLTDANAPMLRALLGGPLTIEQAGPPRMEDRGWRIENGRYPPSSIPDPQMLFKAIDATLGVAGLPQSGTGHTALLAGINAAALHGRHQPHFPPVALRGLLAERSIFRRVVERGGRATFANAFGPGYWQAVESRRIRKSASVIAAEGAGLRFRDGDDLRAGRAVSWDVTNAAMRLREPGAHTPLVGPETAGANLARLAHDHDLVFYESFLPDLAGHGRLAAGDQVANVRTEVQAVLALIDGLLGGVLTEMRASDTLLMTSDHGNVESMAAPTHTRNPVPLLVVGLGTQEFAKVQNIAELADVVVEVALKR